MIELIYTVTKKTKRKNKLIQENEMSICSNASQQSVSVFGADNVEADKAVDLIFKDLQGSLNNAHCATRELIQVPEQDGDYMTAAEIQMNLIDYIDDFNELFKELKSVSKQLLGSCPKGLKDEYKLFVERRKRERAEAKNKLVEERKEQL